MLLSAVMLLACGTSALPTSGQAPARASADRAASPESTLHDATRIALRAIQFRAAAIAKATRDVQGLREELRASAGWQNEVQTAAEVIISGRNVLKTIALPDQLSPLAERLSEATDKCGAAADAIVADLSLTLEERLEELVSAMPPVEAAVVRLDSIPGINRTTALIIVAEIGVDISRYPSDRHLAAWAGLAPGNNETGGKQRASKTRKGNCYLRRALVQAARAATTSIESTVSARSDGWCSGSKRCALA